MRIAVVVLMSVVAGCHRPALTERPTVGACFAGQAVCEIKVGSLVLYRARSFWIADLRAKAPIDRAGAAAAMQQCDAGKACGEVVADAQAQSLVSAIAPLPDARPAAPPLPARLYLSGSGAAFVEVWPHQAVDQTAQLLDPSIVGIRCERGQCETPPIPPPVRNWQVLLQDFPPPGVVIPGGGGISH